jgi:GTP-binding protein
MKIKSAAFETSAPTLAQAPRLAQPEFAFIGRSNVGKSSLLNLLAEKKDLARVSDLPGKTQLMNFYTINSNWRLVDLPGYGYAHVAKTQRADFNEAAANYIEHREALKAVFVLIDPRHEPHAIDLAFMEWIIEAGVPFAVVFTKIDKLSASQAQVGIDRFITASGLDQLDPAPELFATSSKTKAGRTEILQFISARL